MIYRQFGKTGIPVSAIGMGGMRLEDQNKTDDCVGLILAAYESGINYFDTAPGYGKSEDLFGLALQQMLKSRDEKPFSVATKTNKKDRDGVRQDLENSLQRLGLDCIDFYYEWCVYNRDAYLLRKQNGVLDELVKLKEEGLIKHICISTHGNADEIEFMLNDFPFDGVLIGYSVMNFAYREKALRIAEKLGTGVMVMNPLGGGIIPRHPKRFEFIKNNPEETVIEAALRFLFSESRITGALVGLSNKQQLQEAVNAVNGYETIPAARIAEIKSQLSDAFNKMCTNCRYCDHCPQGIPVPKLMEAYNYYLLSGKCDDMFTRLNMHWDVELDNDNCIARCTNCGKCEKLCTQKLDILNRFRNITELADKFFNNKK